MEQKPDLNSSPKESKMSAVSPISSSLSHAPPIENHIAPPIESLGAPSAAENHNALPIENLGAPSALPEKTISPAPLVSENDVIPETPSEADYQATATTFVLDSSSEEVRLVESSATLPAIESNSLAILQSALAETKSPPALGTEKNYAESKSNIDTPDRLILFKEHESNIVTLQTTSEQLQSPHSQPQHPPVANQPQHLPVANQPQHPPLQTSRLKAMFVPGEMFRHYRIEEELGQGGMGIVYRVWDTRLQRQIALKMLLFDSHTEQKDITRFIQEAQVTAQLRHPNIVQVYEVGQEPHPYFTMEYIQGETLKSIIQRKYGLDESITWDTSQDLTPKLVKWIQTCAEGLEFAHQNKIIHRDIKPANIMITKENVAKLMDFGVAKKQDSQITLTNASQGEILGTPSYMSPEQAASQEIDCRSDVYALGSTLYHGLTGRPPYQADSPMQILFQLCNIRIEPVWVCTLNPSIPKELETICHKCLEKDKTKRYASAKALADDLQNFITNKPITAIPATLKTTIYKWIRRNRLTSATIFFVLTSLLVSSCLITWQWIRAENALTKAEEANMRAESALFSEQQQRLEAEKAKAQAEQSQAEALSAKNRAEEETKTARHQLGAALIQRARIYENDKDYFSAKMTLARAVGFENYGGPVINYPPLLKHDSEEWEDAIGSLNSMPDVFPVWKSAVWIPHHSGDVYSVCYSNDGKLLASASADKTVKIWNTESGQCVAICQGHKYDVLSVCFSPDRKFLASGGADNTIRIFSVQTGQCIATYQGHKNSVLSIKYSPDGKFLASAGVDGMIRLWDISTAQCCSTLQGHTGSVLSISYSPDGKFLASAGADKIIRIWEHTTKKCHAILQGHTSDVLSISYSPDGKFLASVSKDNTIRIWDMNANITKAVFTSHGVVNIAYSPSGQHIALGCNDHTIRILDVGTGKRIALFEGHEDVVNCVAYSPGKSFLASASADNTICIWDVSPNLDESSNLPDNNSTHNQQSNVSFTEWKGHKNAVTSISYSPDGNFIVSASEDNTCQVWDSKTGQCMAVLQKHTKLVTDVSYSPDGKFIVSSSNDRTICIWSAQTFQCLFTLSGFQSGIASVCVSFDSQCIAVGFEDCRILVYTLSGGQWILSKEKGQPFFRGHTKSIETLKYSPDGKFLASGSSDCSIRIWNTKTGQCVATYSGHDQPVLSVAYSPDGKFIVSGSLDKTIRLWDSKTGQLMTTIVGHDSAVASVCYSPDGKFIVSGSLDKTIRLWDSKTGQHMATIVGHDDIVTSVCYSPDGKFIVSGSLDKTIRCWGVQYRCVATLIGHIGNVTSIHYHPQGNWIASGSDDNTIRIWNPKNYKCIANPPGHYDDITSISYSPDGKFLASGSWDKTILLCDQSNNPLQLTLSGHASYISSLSFCPDGKFLASGSRDKTIRVWDTQTGRCIAIGTGHDGYVTSVCYHPNGKFLASGSEDQTICIWDTQTAQINQANRQSERIDKQYKILVGHEGAVYSVCYCPDGNLLATAGADKTIQIWDTKSYQCMAVLTGHEGAVYSVCYSPNSNLLATAGADKTIRVWDMKSHKCIAVLTGHEGVIFSLSYSPDGKFLASGSSDKTIKIWDLTWDINYAQYLASIQYRKLEVECLTNTPNLYGKTGSVFSCK